MARKKTVQRHKKYPAYKQGGNDVNGIASLLVSGILGGFVVSVLESLRKPAPTPEAKQIEEPFTDYEEVA